MCSSDLGEVDAIYVDRFLDGRDTIQDNLPKIFRDSGYEGPVYLMSSCPIENYVEFGFDNVIDKGDFQS